MLIRVQDKTCLCNLDRMSGILVCEKKDGECFLTMRFPGTYADNCALGTYKTKERAFEVLDGICNVYQYANECAVAGIGAAQPEFVYYMPEE